MKRKVYIACEGYSTPYKPDNIPYHVVPSLESNKTICGEVFVRSFWFVREGSIEEVECSECKRLSK